MSNFRLAIVFGFALASIAQSQQPFEPPTPAVIRQTSNRVPARSDGMSPADRPRIGMAQSRRQVQQREYLVETSDKWKLVARRYTVKGAAINPQPIVLCHGFTFNSRFFDLNPDISLADYFAQLGYDVWVVDLRGCGKSHKWALTANGGADLLIGRLADKLVHRGIPPTGYVSLDLKFAKWTLDDHVDKDIPALLGLVCKETGKKSVAWIGHSMGGNIMLAYLSKNGQDSRVGKLATIGSQVTMSQSQIMVQFLGELLTRREAQMAGQRINANDLFVSANNVFYNQSNVAPKVVQDLIASQDAPSVGLVRQYLDLSRAGKLLSSNRQIDYSANLNKIRCPMLICCGAADQVAPPTEQIGIYERATAAKKTMWIFGRSIGLSVDYGHCDAIVGPNAAQEVYPRIARWLVEN